MKNFFRAGLAVLGLLFSAPAWAAPCVTTAFAKAAGNWSGATTWVTASGGSTNCTLTAGNAVVFDANTGTGTYTIDASISIASLDTTNALASTTIAHNTGITLTVLGAGSNTFLLSANITYAPVSGRVISFTNTVGTTTITTNGQTLGTITFNGVGGDFVLAGGTFTAAGGMTLTNGTLDNSVNNVNVSTLSLASNNSNTRTLNCGTATWTLSGLAGTVWDYTTTTGLTSSCGNAAIVFANVAVTGIRTWQTGGQSFGAVTLNGSASPPSSQGVGELIVTGAGNTTTFNSLSITGWAFVVFTSSQTFTITNAIIATGSAAAAVFIGDQTAFSGSAMTLSIGTASTCNWCAISTVKFSGAGTMTTTNSIDLGSNTGVVINPPSSGGGRIIGG